MWFRIIREEFRGVILYLLINCKCNISNLTVLSVKTYVPSILLIYSQATGSFHFQCANLKILLENFVLMSLQLMLLIFLY